jgi:hypothetical protein
MRRTYISPEFTYEQVPGTLNMKETRFFQGSKMMEIEDTISISEDTIYWYQNSQKEQINPISEASTNPVGVNLVEIKQTNSKLYLQTNQSPLAIESNARWVLEIDYREILIQYIFGRIKESRTFEGVTARDTLRQNVDLSIRDYIGFNILSRYELSEILFWTKYSRILDTQRLQYENLYDRTIRLEMFKNRQFSTRTNENKLFIEFNQQQPALDWVFDYYYTLNFRKI